MGPKSPSAARTSHSRFGEPHQHGAALTAIDASGSGIDGRWGANTCINALFVAEMENENVEYTVEELANALNVKYPAAYGLMNFLIAKNLATKVGLRKKAGVRRSARLFAISEGAVAVMSTTMTELTRKVEAV